MTLAAQLFMKSSKKMYFTCKVKIKEMISVH